MKGSHLFLDDHNRMIRVLIAPDGKVSANIVDDDGDNIPLEPCVGIVKSPPISKPERMKDLQKQVQSCPLFKRR